MAATANPANLAAVEYEAESAFGEDVTTFGTLRLPILDVPDLSTLVHEKIDSGRVQQYRQGGSQWILGTQIGSTFRTRFWLPGHGSATSGAITVSQLETLLGLVTGNATRSATSGDTLTGGTVSVPTTTSSGTFAAGALCRIGSLGDGRGNGQFYPIDSHDTNSLTLLVETDGAPSNGDVLHSAVNLYPNESPTATSVTSVRMRVLTANLRYELHGCVPTTISFSPFSTGEKPYVDITWAVSWWRESTATFPSSLATEAHNPAPIAAGSVFLNAVGTATRALYDARAFTVNWTLGMELFKGPGGANRNQEYVAARRTRDTITLSMVVDADAATTTPVLTELGRGSTFQHLCFTGSTSAGSAIGWYFRNLCVTNVATQMADQNVNRMRLDATAHTGDDDTSELTLAAAVLAFA